MGGKGGGGERGRCWDLNWLIMVNGANGGPVGSLVSFWFEHLSVEKTSSFSRLYPAAFLVKTLCRLIFSFGMIALGAGDNLRKRLVSFKLATSHLINAHLSLGVEPRQNVGSWTYTVHVVVDFKVMSVGSGGINTCGIHIIVHALPPPPLMESYHQD